VFDLPEAFVEAPRRVAEAGLADRVTFQPGDFMRDPIGQGFDAALVLNVLHYQGAEANVMLLAKIRDALGPGGRVVILEQLRAASPLSIVRLFLATFDLLCVTGMGGGLHTFDDIAAWLRDVGYTDIRRIGLRKSPGSSLIIATRV
jgi:SAM-dependent methyltransferase